MTANHDIVLEVRGVSHWFGPVKVLFDLNLRIARGQIVGLVGPSGCGKSTLLRAIVGTHPPNEGTVYMNGQAVTYPGRDRGIVYQRYSLYPFLTARQNVTFGLKLDQTSIPFRMFRPLAWRKLRREYEHEAIKLLTKVGLGDAVDKYPDELSGGMRQRVAFASAMVMKPQILLLDEPFGALDEATREELQRMLLSLYQENMEAKRMGEQPPYTILMVTHELNEALYVSDRIVGLSQYWDWAAAGHKQLPGASIIYDAPAPVHEPDTPREFEQFQEQRDQIRNVVFEPKQLPDRETHVHFWDDVKAGHAAGVLKP